MVLEKSSKKLIHLLHKIKFWIRTKLEMLDNLPNLVKIPLAIFFLIIGLIFFYVPFVNGIIFLLIGARMLWKSYVQKVFRLLKIENTRTYVSYREALFHILKK